MFMCVISLSLYVTVFMQLCVLLLIQIYLHISVTHLKNSDGNVK